MPMVMLAALFGGYASGAVATVLAVLFVHAFLLPLDTGEARLGLAVFAGGCGLATLTAGAMRTALREMVSREEAAARQLELRTFVEQAPGAIAMFDKDMRYLALSQRWKTDYGLSQDPRGKSHYEIFPEIPERWRVIHANALAGKVEREDEDPFQRRDGTVQWLRWEMRPWFTAGGEIGGAILFSEDITERKIAQLKLRNSEQRLRWALQAADGGAWELDPESGTVWWSPEMYHLWSLPEDSPVTREAIAGFVLEEDRDRSAATIKSAVAAHSRFQLEFRIRHPLKGVRWMATYGRVMRDPESGGSRVAGLTFDVTARKQAETLAQEKAALALQFAKTAEAMPGALLSFRIDRDGHKSVPVASAGLLDVFGLDPEEVRNDAAPLVSRIHPDDLDGVLAAIEESGRTMQPWRSVIRYLHPAKGEVWIERHSSPVREADGSTVWHGYAADITQRKRAEEALASVRRLDAAGQLASSVAHDFNNLLTVMTSNLQLAERRCTDEKVLPFIKRAIDVAEAGAVQNRRLMSLAAGRTLARQTVDVTSRVIETARLLERTFESDIVFEEKVGEAPLLVLVDPSDLDSAVLNLAMNARDAMPSGGRLTFEASAVTLDAATAAELSPLAQAGAYVRVSVKDDGIGMTPEVLANAGQPMFTTKRPGRGTGLGLSSVMAFARAAGGFVTIASTAGAGTEVAVYLPKAGG